MKRWQIVGTLVLGVAVWCWGLSGPAWSQGRGQGFRSCPYTPYMCPLKADCKPFDESGKVVQVLAETLEDSMYPGMAIVVDTKTQGRVHVHLGPAWYLERQEFHLKPGDEVRVKGVCEKKDGKTNVIAYELTHGDFVLHLRDAQGRPHWEAWRKR
ncbi:MAG: DNA-binding protein [Deltaproteobacteria bacterium]|nr:DNA-binding protein [Deltaproteobacteria bacterium]